MGQIFLPVQILTSDWTVSNGPNNKFELDHFISLKLPSDETDWCLLVQIMESEYKRLFSFSISLNQWINWKMKTKHYKEL